MEEDDELVPNADERGFLNISNRAWVNLDPVIWTMSTKIVKLDMSYNHILEIPAQIGELIMLRYALMNNYHVCVLRYNILNTVGNCWHRLIKSLLYHRKLES
jgi:hypothetical protein